EPVRRGAVDDLQEAERRLVERPVRNPQRPELARRVEVPEVAARLVAQRTRHGPVGAAHALGARALLRRRRRPGAERQRGRSGQQQGPTGPGNVPRTLDQLSSPDDAPIPRPGGAAAPPPSSSFQRPAPCHVPLSPRKRGRHVASETPRYPCPFRHSVHPNAAANSRCTARNPFASSRASPLAIPQTSFAVTTPHPPRLPASTARSQADG